jgi:hypothetical protein
LSFGQGTLDAFCEKEHIDMNPFRYSFAESEIQPRLSLHLLPEELWESPEFCSVCTEIATTHDPEGNPCLARGKRDFIVVRRLGAFAAMVPTFARYMPGRIPITNKTGHPEWVARLRYAAPGQLWVAPVGAIVRAADRAGDLSSPPERNLISPGELNQILKAIGWALFPGPADVSHGCPIALLPTA